MKTKKMQNLTSNGFFVAEMKDNHWFLMKKIFMIVYVELSVSQYLTLYLWNLYLKEIKK